jgi:hypothetical protein
MLYNIKLQKNNIYLKIMATPWLLSTKKKKIFIYPPKNTCSLRNYETFRSSHQWLIITESVGSQFVLQNFKLFLES